MNKWLVLAALLVSACGVESREKFGEPWVVELQVKCGDGWRSMTVVRQMWKYNRGFGPEFYQTEQRTLTSGECSVQAEQP